MKAKSVLIVLMVVAVLAGVFFYVESSRKTDKETTSIAEESIAAISARWDVEELKRRADPGLINAMASQGQSAEELVKVYSALGPLKSPPSCHVRTTGQFMKEQKPHSTISFECMGNYEKGQAVISLTLSKADEEEKWVIYYLNIHSDVFGEIIE